MPTNTQVTHLNRVLQLIISGLSNPVEHVLADEGDDALLSLLLLAHHGVGLACPCLSVGKDTHVVPWRREINRMSALAERSRKCVQVFLDSYEFKLCVFG